MTEAMITLEWLRDHTPYDEFIWPWWRHFGNNATIADMVQWLHENNRQCGEAWLLGQTPKLTKAALAVGADVHANCDEALVEATYFGRLGVVKILCAAGVDANARGGQALRMAVLWGHLEIVKELRAAGADFSVIDADLLEEAEMNGHIEVVDYVKSITEEKNNGD